MELQIKGKENDTIEIINVNKDFFHPVIRHVFIPIVLGQLIVVLPLLTIALSRYLSH